MFRQTGKAAPARTDALVASHLTAAVPGRKQGVHSKGFAVMDVLAVVPIVRTQDARPLAGRPLALHTVDQARSARQVTRVVAVTANGELTRLMANDGTDVVEAGAAEDHPVLLRIALECLAERDGFAPDMAVLLDPAFPLRAPGMIDEAIHCLRQSGADSLISAYPLAGAVWVRDELGAAQPWNRNAGQRRFAESGIVAAIRIGAFSRTGQLPTGRVVLYEVPPAAALRVEDGADWADVEALHRRGQAARARARLRGVSLLVFDFDGVMTDNRVLVFEDGREAVLCNRGDGMGLEMLRKAGVPIVVISKEINPVVGARCKKLKIPYLQGIDDKLAELTRLVRERGLELAHVGYMGNDINDLECMRAAGLAIAPADSHPEALQIADLVTSSRGGFGAVREVCDLLLAATAS